MQDALRSVVRKVLADAARNGLVGDHHFNIAFKTQAPASSRRLRSRAASPDEMSIVLQHEFWDLVVTPDAFEVSLNFSRKPERLVVPFDSITGFTDPSVPFGFKLEPRVSEPASNPAPALEEKKSVGGRSWQSLRRSKPTAQARARPRICSTRGEARRGSGGETKSCRSTPSARNSRGEWFGLKSSICVERES